MNAVALIAEAESEGIVLAVAGSQIIWHSDREPQAQLLAQLASHKPEIIALLVPTKESPPLRLDDQRLVLAWLDHIGETDPVEVKRVAHRCRSNPESLAYVISMAVKAGITASSLSTPPASAKPTQAEVDPLLGLPVLPDDRRFIQTRLGGKTLARRRVLLTEYRRRWIEASGQEQAAHRKDNSGRRFANAWLREATDQE